jgi:hypothetical protein
MTGLFRCVGVALMVWIGCSACGSEGAGKVAGTLAMRLSTELDGVTFQLRGAAFDVTGPESTTFIADTPEATSIRITLNAGDYTILLRSGWQLERQATAGMPFEAVEAELVTPNPAMFAIADGAVTQVAYEFQVTESRVPFGEGDLDLTIRVRAPDAGTAEDASTPPPPAPSFERDVWPIFRANCSPCHTTGRSGGHSVGSASLSTAYADATRLNTRLLDRLDGGGMPPSCSSEPGDPGCISVQDLATIALWIESGTPL